MQSYQFDLTQHLLQAFRTIEYLLAPSVVGECTSASETTPFRIALGIDVRSVAKLEFDANMGHYFTMKV